MLNTSKNYDNSDVFFIAAKKNEVFFINKLMIKIVLKNIFNNEIHNIMLITGFIISVYKNSLLNVQHTLAKEDRICQVKCKNLQNDVMIIFKFIFCYHVICLFGMRLLCR